MKSLAFLGIAYALKMNAISKTTIHVVPHSHNDLGWLKTLDQCYTGEGDVKAKANARMLITNYIIELEKDKNKKFSQVEMKFFSMWWDE